MNYWKKLQEWVWMIKEWIYTAHALYKELVSTNYPELGVILCNLYFYTLFTWIKTPYFQSFKKLHPVDMIQRVFKHLLTLRGGESKESTKTKSGKIELSYSLAVELYTHYNYYLLGKNVILEFCLNVYHGKGWKEEGEKFNFRNDLWVF